MPQNTDYKASNSETQPIGYKERLNSWAVTRLIPGTPQEIIARFRSRSNAEGYMQHISQLVPHASFMVIFDCKREEVAI
jgi:hypothetical protein